MPSGPYHLCCQHCQPAPQFPPATLSYYPIMSPAPHANHPLADGSVDTTQPLATNTGHSPHHAEKDDYIIPPRDLKKKLGQDAFMIAYQDEERVNGGSGEFAGGPKPAVMDSQAMVDRMMPSPSMSFRSKNCGSPRRVYSPRPKLNGYMQSLTSHQSAMGAVSGAAGGPIGAISPNNRQSIKNK